MEIPKPSEKVLANKFDGKEVKDSLGRTLKLRKPDVLDNYDLMSALGEDANNTVCRSYAVPILYIAAIDGALLEAPKSYKEFRAALKRVGEEGIQALSQYMESVEVVASKEGQVNTIKKS